MGLPPRWFSGKESTCQCRRCRFSSWVGKIPWRRKWQCTAVFTPGKSQGQRSLASCSPWGRKRIKHDLATKQQLRRYFMDNWIGNLPLLSEPANCRVIRWWYRKGTLRCWIFETVPDCIWLNTLAQVGQQLFLSSWCGGMEVESLNLYKQNLQTI